MHNVRLYREAKRHARTLGFDLSFDDHCAEYRAAPMVTSAVVAELRAAYDSDLESIIGTVIAEYTRGMFRLDVNRVESNAASVDALRAIQAGLRA